MSERIPPTEYIEYYSSTNTRMTYSNGIKRYLEIVTGRKIDYSELDDVWIHYITSGNYDPVRDLIKFPRMALEQGYAPRTIQDYLKPAELYLKEIWEIQLTAQQRKMRKRSEPKYQSISKHANLKREQIAKILLFAGIRTRFEILLSVSSGLRIGEILSLEFSDIDLDSKPARVRVQSKNSKNKMERITHMSSEAVEALQTYLVIRESELWHGKSAARAIEARDGKRIIPFVKSTEEALFRQAVEKAGLLELDENTGRSVIHFHSLRAFFSTRAHRSECPDTFVEYLMGHSGYLADAYWQPSEEDRAEMYAMIEPHVTINIPDDYMEIKVRQASEIADLQHTNAHLVAELTVLKAALDRIQKEQERQSVSLISGVPHRRLYIDDPEVTDAE